MAGVCRGWALQALPASEHVLQPDAVLTADAVFLCNAVRGILPVVSLDRRMVAQDPALDELQGSLAMAYPMFASTAGNA